MWKLLKITTYVNITSDDRRSIFYLVYSVSYYYTLVNYSKLLFTIISKASNFYTFYHKCIVFKNILILARTQANLTRVKFRVHYIMTIVRHQNYLGGYILYCIIYFIIIHRFVMVLLLCTYIL